jgi:hypothetical protein
MAHPTSDKIANWRLWWFAQLEAALDRGDDRAVTAAVRKLQKLGIEIRFTLPPRLQEVRRE